MSLFFSKKLVPLQAEKNKFIIMKKLGLIFVAFVCATLCLNTFGAYAQQQNTMNCQQKEMVFKNQKNAADSTKLSLPEYEGGMKELRKYIRENLEYPEVLRSVEADATCMVQFTVGSNGEVSEVSVAQTSGFPEMDEEAVRVASSFPNWTPATKNGVAIAMKTQVPFHFKYVPAEEDEE